MRYENLNQLLQKSSSSRKYFLSLPVCLQMELHRQDNDIHTAAELHRRADLMETYNRQIQNSEYYHF